MKPICANFGFVCFGLAIVAAGVGARLIVVPVMLVAAGLVAYGLS